MKVMFQIALDLDIPAMSEIVMTTTISATVKDALWRRGFKVLGVATGVTGPKDVLERINAES